MITRRVLVVVCAAFVDFRPDKLCCISLVLTLFLVVHVAKQPFTTVTNANTTIEKIPAGCWAHSIITWQNHCETLSSSSLLFLTLLSQLPQSRSLIWLEVIVVYLTVLVLVACCITVVVQKMVGHRIGRKLRHIHEKKRTKQQANLQVREAGLNKLVASGTDLLPVSEPNMISKTKETEQSVSKTGNLEGTAGKVQDWHLEKQLRALKRWRGSESFSSTPSVSDQEVFFFGALDIDGLRPLDDCNFSQSSHVSMSLEHDTHYDLLSPLNAETYYNVSVHDSSDSVSLSFLPSAHDFFYMQRHSSDSEITSKEFDNDLDCDEQSCQSLTNEDIDVDEGRFFQTDRKY